MTDLLTLSRRVSEAEGPGFFRKLFLCAFGLCQTFKQQADETGCWGECAKCGERVGFVSRADLRRYCEREEAKTRTLLAIHERNKSDDKTVV